MSDCIFLSRTNTYLCQNYYNRAVLNQATAKMSEKFLRHNVHVYLVRLVYNLVKTSGKTSSGLSVSLLMTLLSVTDTHVRWRSVQSRQLNRRGVTLTSAAPVTSKLDPTAPFDKVKVMTPISVTQEHAHLACRCKVSPSRFVLAGCVALRCGGVGCSTLRRFRRNVPQSAAIYRIMLYTLSCRTSPQCSATHCIRSERIHSLYMAWVYSMPRVL